MDNRGGTDVDSKTLFVGNDAPTASFTISPNPAISRTDGDLQRRPRRAISTVPIMKYEWDLDGNGTFETNTGTDRDHVAGLCERCHREHRPAGHGRRRGDGHDDARVQRQVGQLSERRPRDAGSQGLLAHGGAVRPDVCGLQGLEPRHRLRGRRGLREPGRARRREQHGRPLRRHHRLRAGEPRSLRVHGGDGRVLAEMGCLRGQRRPRAWSSPSNFNQNDGGFLVDPNSADGTFSVAIGRDTSRNSISFTRPSPNQWHHYVFVLDTTAPAATQITPYVDGQPVAYSQDSERHRGSGRSQTRRSISCRAAARASSVQALSTRWRSTTAR